MNDRQLLYMLKIGEHARITEAARELFVTPSTLIKSLQKTEAELKTKLFYRDGKVLHPTYAGTRFLQYAQDFLNLQEQMLSEMSAIRALSNDLIRIGIQISNDDKLLNAVSLFHEEYPGAEVQISEGTSMHLLELLDNNEIDFMVVYNSALEGKWDYSCIELHSSEAVVVTPREHPLVKKAVWEEGRKYPVIDLALLEEENLLYHTSHQEGLSLLQRICEEGNFSFQTTIRATTISTILKLVFRGNGVALTFDQMANPFVNSLNLSLLSFGNEPIQRSLMIVHRADRQLSEAAQKLIALCQNQFQSQV